MTVAAGDQANDRDMLLFSATVALRREHDRDIHCDDLDARATTLDDGEQAISCGGCGHVLLSWGGGE